MRDLPLIALQSNQHLNSKMKIVAILILVGITFVSAQYDTFSGANYAAKPTIQPELRKYFELDGHAAELISTLMGPRPGGFFPEKTYDVARVTAAPGSPIHEPSGLEKTLESFFTAPAGPNPGDLPPGFNQGFSLLNGNRPALSSFSEDSKSVNADQQSRSSKSSIAGIPNVPLKLPVYKPYGPEAPDVRRSQPYVVNRIPDFPKIESRPEVPEGGLGFVETESNKHPSSVSEVFSSSATNAEEYGKTSLADDPKTHSGLIGTLIDIVMNNENKPANPSEISKAFGNILGGQDSPVPGKNLINNALYKVLTSGSLFKNESDPESTTPLTLNNAQKEVIEENLSMIQDLITQSESPLCQKKPVPVTTFNIDAFMGQWYQVVYSQLASKNLCSMMNYKKLSQNDGVGTVFEVFEYSTDGIPYSEPKITSGYGILKEPGEILLRTNNAKEDVGVHIIYTGPINNNGEYDFVILSLNCNFPVYVFARNPTIYKQRYESAVTQILIQKNILNGFSRLLNTVQSVDTSSCQFPPSLFKFQG